MSDLTELRERIVSADDTLTDLAATSGPNEQLRLVAKRDGVRLCLSYIDEILRSEAFAPADDGQVETARITIVRKLTDEGVLDFLNAVAPGGDDLPLTEALGMMRLAEDTLIRERMEDTP